MLRRCVAVGTNLPLAGCTTNKRVAFSREWPSLWYIHWSRSSRESRTKLPAAEWLCAASYTQREKVVVLGSLLYGVNVVALIGAVIPRVSRSAFLERLDTDRRAVWSATAATQNPWMWCPSWTERHSFNSREGKLSVLFFDFCVISAVLIFLSKKYQFSKQKVYTYKLLLQQ